MLQYTVKEWDLYRIRTKHVLCFWHKYILCFLSQKLLVLPWWYMVGPIWLERVLEHTGLAIIAQGFSALIKKCFCLRYSCIDP
jgi:hypothetical protein